MSDDLDTLLTDDGWDVLLINGVAVPGLELGLADKVTDVSSVGDARWVSEALTGTTSGYPLADTTTATAATTGHRTLTAMETLASCRNMLFFPGVVQKLSGERTGSKYVIHDPISKPLTSTGIKEDREKLKWETAHQIEYAV